MTEPHLPPEPKFDVEIMDDETRAAWRAAKLFEELSIQAISARGAFHVALSGGSTPRVMYSILGDEPFIGVLDWDKIHFWWGDERCVPSSNRESNFRMAREALLDKLVFPETNIHRVKGELNPEKAAADYEDQLRVAFPAHADGPPPLDLILLGMGADGHTASLFPGTASLEERDRWVVAVVANEAPQPGGTGGMGVDRVTFTFPMINRARIALALVVGAAKSARVAEALDPESRSDIPIRRARPEKGRMIWILDKAAASGLNNEG